jgi:hypothetical protein
MSFLSPRLARIAAAVFVVASVGVLAGCGGEGTDSPADADRLALEQVTLEIEDAALSSNVEAFCDLVQPSLVKQAFGGRQGCLKVSRSAVTPESPLAALDVEAVVTDGEGAIVTYEQEPPGQVLFARENGTWYIALEEVARARRQALQNRNQN